MHQKSEAYNMNLKHSPLRRISLLSVTLLMVAGSTLPAQAFWTATAYIIWRGGW